MNKLLDLVISSMQHIGEQIKLNIMSFYNKTYNLINKNFTLNKIYKPIIDEKVNINKKLKETLNQFDSSNQAAKSNILNLEAENILLQTKISIIEDLLTKRHD